MFFNFLYSKVKRKTELSRVKDGNVKNIPLHKLVSFAVDFQSKNEFIKARLCREEAAKRGDEFSIINLSRIYSTDFYGFKNRKLAIELLSNIALSSSEASRDLAFIMNDEGSYDKAYYYSLMSIIIDNGLQAHGLTGVLNRTLEVNTRKKIISDVRKSAKEIIATNKKWDKWLASGCPV